MNNYLFKLFFSFIIAICLCYFCYFFFNNIISKYQIHNSERLSELLVNQTYHDVLFLGSSRTHFGINPHYVDSICKVNSYNAGVEGGGMYEFEMMLRAYLEHHKAPKFLFLNFDMHSFTGDPKIFNYPVYYPYYSKNNIIKQYLLDNKNLNQCKIVFPFLQITDYDDNTKGFFLKGLLGRTEIQENDFQYKGYISNTDVTLPPVVTPLTKVNLSINQLMVNCFERIIKICEENNIRLIITYLPEYQRMYQKSTNNRDEIFKIINNRVLRNKLLFINHDEINICSNPKYFANITHLNKEGAREYSEFFANSIKDIIKK